MGAELLLAGLLMAQGTGPAITVEATVEQDDVAYSELMARRPDAAISRIKANDRLESDNPAALINLGAAEVQRGRTEAARGYYRAAMISTDRADLQLADGRWMDSRRIARLAESKLLSGEVVALRLQR